MRACTTGGVVPLFLTAAGRGADVARGEGREIALGNNVAGVTRNIVGEAG